MMHLASRRAFGIYLACVVLWATPGPLFSQQISASLPMAESAGLPEAPQAQSQPATNPPQAQQTPAQTPAAQGSSSSQTAAPLTDAQKSQQEKAEEQLKAQEHQRVMGVMATFNTTSNKDA